MPTGTTEKYLVTAMSAVFLFFGIAIVLPGTLLPSIMAKFELRLFLAGVLLSASSGGYVIAVLAAGVLVDRVGHKSVLLAGALICAVSLGLFGWVDDYVAAVLLLFLFGIGSGALEVVPNAALIPLGPARSARALNIAHLFFGIGAFAGPLATGAVLKLGIDWAWVFVGGAAGFGIVAVFVLPCRFPPIRGRTVALERSVIFSPSLLALSLLLGVYVGVEMGVASWLTKYMVSAHGRTEPVAAAVLSVYWLALAAGRLMIAFNAHRTSESRLVLIMAVAGSLTVVLAVLATGPWTAAFCFVSTAFFIGSIYPMVIAWGGRLYPAHPGTASGIMALGGALGALVFPCMMSALADFTESLRIGMSFYIVLSVLMVPCTRLVVYHSRRRRSGIHEP